MLATSSVSHVLRATARLSRSVDCGTAVCYDVLLSCMRTELNNHNINNYTVQRHRGGGRERGDTHTERGPGPSKTARRHRPQHRPEQRPKHTRVGPGCRNKSTTLPCTRKKKGKREMDLMERGCSQAARKGKGVRPKREKGVLREKGDNYM